MPDVLILTGPPGSGKSSAAQALASRYDRVAHIRVDQLDEFIAPTGHVHPWGKPEVWRHQRRLDIRNACCIALNFLAERFAVIVDDTLTTAEEATWYRDGLRDAGVPVHLIRLLPRLEVCLQRNAGRDSRERMRPSHVETAYRQVEALQMPGAPTIDNSQMSPDVTADRLQALTTSGESIVWPASTEA
ncbi:MAG TPA: ATP-binding protein [Dehalococcoidia bacterium]|nr:ATP-binding protein [Dehalococcoidia bacterium]